MALDDDWFDRTFIQLCISNSLEHRTWHHVAQLVGDPDRANRVVYVPGDWVSAGEGGLVREWGGIASTLKPIPALWPEPPTGEDRDKLIREMLRRSTPQGV